MQQPIISSRNWYADAPFALKLFLWIVVIPTLLAAIYYGLIASDIYISETRFAVRSSEQNSIPTGSILSSVIPGVSESSDEDASIVRDYILSLDMLKKLDKQLDLRDHYTSSKVDFFSRLDADASQEQFLEYYRQMIGVSVDSSSQIITLQVKSFEPQVAKQMAQIIINQSEKLVNALSDRIIDDTLRFARSEVNKSEERVRKASDAITDFRNETLSMDPDAETKGALQIIANLEGNVADARAKLLDAKSFMQPDSPKVKVLQTKVNALENQIKDERERLASNKTGMDYTKLIDRYQPLVLEQELAKQRYASALTSLESARAEAQRKQRYLLTFVKPQLPDSAVLPNRFHDTLVIFLGLCLIYSIGGLVWAAIKDHMRL